VRRRHPPAPEEPADTPPYGLRGWLLLWWGSVWLTWGLTLTTDTEGRAQSALYDAVTLFLPLHAWGWVWIALGAAGALAGLARRHYAGFLLVSAMPIGWGIGLMAAFFTAGSVSGLPLGYTFFALGVSIAITSRMEDVRVLLRRSTS